MKKIVFMVLILALGTGNVLATDFNGDGTDDVAVFRSNTGLWAIRGVSRLYFGSGTDLPIPADYNGDGAANPAIFRNSTGLWAIKDVTRIYFGGECDQPLAGDYNGDGTSDLGVFRATTGLWAIRDVSRLYYGTDGDIPVGSSGVSSFATVKYIGTNTHGAEMNGVDYVDWTGETKYISDPGLYWSTSFTAQSGDRLFLDVFSLPTHSGTYAKLIVNDVLVLDIETQDSAGFDGRLLKDEYGNYYFDGTTWEE